MRLLADENVSPAHVSALESAGHDVRRVREVLETGASDDAVLAAAQDADRVVVTYDRKDFGKRADHSGILIVTESLPPGGLRRAVARIERAYPSLDDVVEYPADWV